jgi:uncharacterized membrane protein YphA (DoxX/SURF4 family)
MACPVRDHVWLSLALLLNRLSMGPYLLLAGIGKFKWGVERFYQEGFMHLKPPWLPGWFAWPYGHAVPFIEVLLGAGLILGLMGRAVAGLATLTLLSFTIAVWQAGMFFDKAGSPFHTNVILITLTFLLAVAGPGAFSVDGVLGARSARKE